MNPTLRKIILLNIALDIIIFDQISKWAVTEMVLRPHAGAADSSSLDLLSWFTQTPERLPFTGIEMTSFFNLVMVWNEGVSFGLFNGSANGPIILTALSLGITVLFLIWLLRSDSWVQGSALALVIGGAIGNVIDRVRFGAVIDFLDVHAFGYHWPAFNLADSCIVVGVGILIFSALFLEKNLPS